ncbi:hypothetical protein H2O73_00735 [Vibrio sp. 404]|uniref:Uncharacterized protein n=1 Tax=Vibrio marinisediminis TaxID=2758441 RepID=A0A7W2IRW1_9VIBR|nr:hypothetical protein [Vibrio marinisediminis]MBA5760851.1 hypothetical protein [Vibrio marinisediminis]
MSALQAIPTPHGIEILNSELKNTVTQYRLIGALTHDAASDALHSFHTATIETSYYDENGVLTFILNLPIETHFDEYLHRIDVLDSQNQAVIECPTPKIALAKGIGGIVTLKAAISGQAGDVVFKHGEYVTETELFELYMSPLENKIKNIPIYPEVLNSENRLNVALNDTKLTIGDNQKIRFYGWLDVDLDKWSSAISEFVAEPEKTYHLRFELGVGFNLFDLSSLSYNPDQLLQTDTSFDSTYSNALLAIVQNGMIITLTNAPQYLLHGVNSSYMGAKYYIDVPITLNWSVTPRYVHPAVNGWAEDNKDAWQRVFAAIKSQDRQSIVARFSGAETNIYATTGGSPVITETSNQYISIIGGVNTNQGMAYLENSISYTILAGV